MEIQMICMDLDGTALQKDRVSFSPRLIRALEQAHEKKIAVVPVTGRQYGLLPPPLKSHPAWENLVVLCNGGQIRRLATGERLFGLDISEEALHRLLALAEKYTLPIEFSVESRLYLTEQSLRLQSDDPGLKFHRDVILAQCGHTVGTLESMCADAVEKVNLLCIPQQHREVVERELQEIAVSAVWSSHNCMEITHPHADKGRGLEAVCSLLNIPVENTMALGDSGNDIAMLYRAGLGVAVGNAPDFVKEAADVIVPSFDADGAAIAIERYVLGME